MKISFVIPAHNEENYIGDCLRSIFSQLRKKDYDVEITVVNNASTDRTADVARSFTGVKVVDEPRKGSSQARQTGFIASTGDLIANVDADTIIPAGWLDTVMNEFSARQKLIALSGPVIYHDLSKTTNMGVRLYYYSIVFFAYVMNRFVFRAGSFVQGAGCVIRRSALEAIGGYDTSFSFYGDDGDMARRLHPLGDVVFTFKLPIYSSGRRLLSEGRMTMMARYSVNYFWAMFFKKPFTKVSSDIRNPHI